VRALNTSIPSTPHSALLVVSTNGAVDPHNTDATTGIPIVIVS
jgi:hypothetical protein